MELLITPQIHNVATSCKTSTVVRHQLPLPSVTAWTMTHHKEDNMIASLAFHCQHYYDKYYTKSITVVAELHIRNTHSVSYTHLTLPTN
eukprot:2029657-Ditylum_brightwellii.AAC.1